MASAWASRVKMATARSRVAGVGQEKIRRAKADQAIILTRSHVVSEFFHVDWTSRARRKIGVPILHLLEHETFDEQAGSGEGISGA